MIPQPPPIYVIPGMRVGCLPFNALIASTLECFYDEVCLNMTATWISTLSPTAWPRPLNASLSSRFQPNTSVSYIMSEQMVEKWTNTTNFTGYYEACSPIECTYTIIRRSELLYVLTTLIGSFGGLMVVLRVVSPLIIRLFRSMAAFYSERNRRNTVQLTHQPGIIVKDRLETTVRVRVRAIACSDSILNLNFNLSLNTCVCIIIRRYVVSKEYQIYHSQQLNPEYSRFICSVTHPSSSLFPNSTDDED